MAVKREVGLVFLVDEKAHAAVVRFSGCDRRRSEAESGVRFGVPPSKEDARAVMAAAFRAAALLVEAGVWTEGPRWLDEVDGKNQTELRYECSSRENPADTLSLMRRALTRKAVRP